MQTFCPLTQATLAHLKLIQSQLKLTAGIIEGTSMDSPSLQEKLAQTHAMLDGILAEITP